MGIKFVRGNITLYIGEIPGRRSEAVCLVEGATYRPLAYCRSDRDRDALITALKELMAPIIGDDFECEPELGPGSEPEAHL